MKAAGSALLMLLAGGVQDDGFDRTLAALRAGTQAATTGDTRHLRSAAADLTAIGATPLDGGDDLAARWARGGKKRSSPAYRNRVLGPGYRSVTVTSSGVWHSEQAFLAGQRARVGIVPTHGGSYRLQIIGDDHELVCHVSPPHGQCDFVPAYTARFSIEVRNTGSATEEFLVVVQ